VEDDLLKVLGSSSLN